MKKFICIALLSFSVFVVSPGCSNTQNSTAGTVTNTVIAVLASVLQQIGGASATASIDAQTRLNSILQTPEQVNTFKNLISTTYKIPQTTVDNAYSGFRTVQNVANFVVKTAEDSMLPKS